MPSQSPTPPSSPVPTSHCRPSDAHPVLRPRLEHGDQDIHAYRPPNGASRSPCPCLNALANHSYLPHDGRNITFFNIISALQKGMGFSRGFALFMAIGTFTLLRRPTLAPFDLHGTARHNFIEHNASIVHKDVDPGEEFAPIDTDPTLLKELLDMAHPSAHSEGNVITEEDYEIRLVTREEESLPLDALHAELRNGETAMVIEAFGKNAFKELAPKDLEVFLKDGRFPDGWTPTRKLRLFDAIARSKRIRLAVRALKESHPKDVKPHGGGGVFGWVIATVSRLMDHKPPSIEREV